ncbi:MAG TPA: insulinase family protein [Candidatus Sulfopaludibacter sp.]|jgi:zinc protease|nr:insulinase family protein [Candidatus Sulfopaludibacter sp.]
MSRNLSILPAIALFALAAGAQTLPSGVQKKASVGGITEYDYPNGLRVLLYPDAANPKVTVNMIYLVGSRHEGYGETGMAHLLEHLDFIETTNGRQIKNEIVAHGANWNGTTDFDRTNYYETVTSTDDNLKWALGLETDRMAHVKFTKQILDTEMTVVRNEFERGENSPQSILSERVAATAFLWHNYGKSTIGSKEDIEKVPVDRLEAFYHKFYQPDNAVLVITGRLDESKTLQYVADTVGKLPRPTRKLEQTYTVEPPQDGERYVELRRVGTGQEVIVAYHSPAAGHPDAAAFAVLSGIMTGGGGGSGGRGGGGGGAEGRLTKALVDNKLATSASMRFEQLHDPGLVQFSANLTNDQSLDAAKQAIYKVIAGVISEPPTKDEVERIKAGMLRQLENSLSDAQTLGVNGLTTPVSQGDWRLMFLQHDRIKDVTPEDLVRVAKTYFKASNRTVGYYIPDAAPDRTTVPATPDLDALLTGYKSSVSITHGEAFDPTPANIEKRVVRSKLSNGMKMVILPKQTENSMVSAVIELRFGDANSLKGKNSAAQFAGSLMGRATLHHTQEQLRDEMQKLNARIQVSGGGGGGGRGGRGGGGGGGGISSANTSVTAPAANFPAAMKLAVEMLREPAYPEADFDRTLQQRIKSLEVTPTEPTQLGAEMLSRHLSPFQPGDVMYSPTREEQLADLKKVTLEDAKKFHDQFYGANYGVLAVVGPVDQAGLRKTAEELLGKWNTSMAYQPIPARYKAASAINRKIETPDKANAQFEAGARFAMSESDPDYPAMLLAGYMFGGPITSHISDRIRNREGLSYGANARVAIPTEGDAALLSGTVSLNPVNGPKVEFSFVDELKKTLKDGFTAAEVAEAKKAYLDTRANGRAQDTALLGQLASHEMQSRTMQWDAQLEAKIQALTPEQINAAFRKHIDPAAVSIVKAGDFKAAGVYQ